MRFEVLEIFSGSRFFERGERLERKKSLMIKVFNKFHRVSESQNHLFVTNKYNYGYSLKLTFQLYKINYTLC